MTKAPAVNGDEWFTPPALIASLGQFDLDPACGPLCPNTTATTRLGIAEDGLTAPWAGRVWLNPPFSNAAPFIRRLAAHGNGIGLVFARVDAAWFQQVVNLAGAVFLLHGRIQFQRPGGKESRCPLGCCLLPFGASNLAAVASSGLRGTLLTVAPGSPANQ